MRTRKLSIAVVVALCGALLIVAAPSPASAVETTFDACPASAESFVDDNTTLYPPFGAADGDASGLVDCTSSYSPPVDAIDAVAMTFAFDGLPTDPCYEIVELSITTTGLPEGFGWGITGYNVNGTVPIETTSGYAGAFQMYSALAGELTGWGGEVLESPVAQPPSGSYSVTSQLVTDVISLDDLAAGNMGVALNAVNGEEIDVSGPDVVEDVQVSVTLDDAGCQPTTTTTMSTTSTTTTTVPAPLPVTPVTTATAARTVATTPAFTG